MSNAIFSKDGQGALPSPALLAYVSAVSRHNSVQVLSDYVQTSKLLDDHAEVACL